MPGTRRRFRLLLCAIFAALCCASQLNAQIVYGGTAQQPPPVRYSPTAEDPNLVNQKPDTKKYNLSGAVVNSQTGEGVPRALVEINAQISTLTDSNGNFAFDGLAAGTYYVSSQKPGYFNQQATDPRMAVTNMAKVGPGISSITIKLIPEALISGRVTDSDGLPVQNLPVQCLRSAVVEGRRQWQVQNTASTDEDGEYRVPGLMPGTYLVVAGPSQIPSIGAMTKTGGQFGGYTAAFYPAPDDTGAQSGARIVAGQRVTADFVVDAERFYTVSGTFNAPAGLSVWINLFPTDSTRTPHNGAMMRDSNSFTLRMLPKGDYMLQAGAQVENKTWAAYLPLHVASDISGLQISLAPAISIPVNISVQRTQAAPASGPVAIVVGAGGRQLRIPTLAQVLLRSIGQSQQQYAATSQSNDGSSVAFDNLAPGSYKLSVMPFQNLYLASARYGTTDLLRDDLVVSGSAAADPIEIVLRDDGGKVKGTVTRDGQPAHGALLVVPDHGTPYLPREHTTTDSGEFLLREVQPGSYSILAFDSLNDLEYANPEALDPFMSHAAHVDVIANQEASVTLEVIKRGEE